MKYCRSLVQSDLGIFSLVFIAIMLATVIQVMRQPRMYEARATLRFYQEIPTQAVFSGPREDPWPTIEAIRLSEFLKKVGVRLTDEERVLFLKPYHLAQVSADGESIERLIHGGLIIDFKANILSIHYRNHDRFLAARIASLFADEFIAYQARLRIDEEMKQVEELVLRAKYQQRLVNDLTEEMSDYRREKNTTESVETDGPYQALLKRQADARKTLDALIPRIRDTTMICGPTPLFWRVMDNAVPANEDDYLIAPMVRRFAWGVAVAVVGGLLTVGVVNVFSRGRGPDDNRQEGA
ncbi:MAG: hypothetical protein ACAH89_14480 [Rariglobus sp.]